MDKSFEKHADLFINPFHGMELYPGYEKGTRDNENGILFYVTYLMLKDILGKLTTEDVAEFSSICEGLRTILPDGSKSKGLFDRGRRESADLTDSALRTISHDNMTAIVCFSYVHGLPYHKWIYEHGKKYQWRFDNVKPEKPRWGRFLHPEPLIFYAILGGSKLARLFHPLLFLSLLHSCAKKYKVRPAWRHRVLHWLKTGEKLKTNKWVHTDGKILTLLMLWAYERDSWVFRIGGKLLRKALKSHFGADYYHKIFKIYYRWEEHPVRILSSKLVPGEHYPMS